MRALACLLFAACLSLADPRIDNVLVRMTPPGSTSLVGAHMDAIRQTSLYRRMVAEQKLPDVDRFAAETGFDPRRDVREILYVTAPGQQSVLLARGIFHPNVAGIRDVKIVRHGEYSIFVNVAGDAGFCILDSTLAAAGDLSAINAALDEWKFGTQNGAQTLLSHATPIPPSSQLWGVSTGAGAFLAGYMPRAQSGIDFSKIFQALSDTWFFADFSAGVRATVHGAAQNQQDAASLRDAAKGLVGLGRLSVPENEPELLRVWDGITVSQTGRAISINADIPQNLVDKLVAMFQTQAPRRGRMPRGPGAAK